MYKFLLSMVCVLSLNAEMVGGVAIVVKDKAITLYDIKKEMRNSKVSMEMATNALIRQKLEISEVNDRRIKVSNSEVYDDIKETAKRNNMSVNDFYEAALNANGLNSAEIKERVKQKLLSKKLYMAIAYSKATQPSEAEIKEYYELNKAKFSHPSAFTTVIYKANNKSVLQTKINNPMFYSPEVTSNEQLIPYGKISPELANLLESTPLNSFTPVVPDGQGGYISFYIKQVHDSDDSNFSNLKNQIINTLMAQQRERVLSDYFARLQDNADIKVIRKTK
ncbi:peptidylprolyl isomerase [Sulfurimonas sp.]